MQERGEAKNDDTLARRETSKSYKRELCGTGISSLGTSKAKRMTGTLKSNEGLHEISYMLQRCKRRFATRRT